MLQNLYLTLNFKSVLLNGSEVWRTTKANTKSETVINGTRIGLKWNDKSPMQSVLREPMSNE